jgi:hypothetical protein
MSIAIGAMTLAVSLVLADSKAGYLISVPSKPDKSVQQKTISYVPREGDLIFYDEHSVPWTIFFALAGTGPPLHMGIVVKKSNGALAVLEAGPDDTVWVRLLDLAPRLHQFQKDFGGTISIRRCKIALSRARSAALTRFALAQEGKPYAVLRLLLQGTPFRERGVFAPFLAHTYLNRDSWICSELAVAAGTVAGLFDPKVVRANVTYPLDVVDNRCHDLRAVWHDALEWRPNYRRMPNKK